MNLILAMILLYMVKIVLYGTLKLEEKYTYDKEKAQNVYGTTEEAHPGVKKYMKKGTFI